MKRPLASGVLVAMICAAGLAQDASDAVTEADIVPGTRVAMKKPDGLKPAKRFPGFIDEDRRESRRRYRRGGSPAAPATS